MRFAAAACAFLLLVARPVHAQLRSQLLVTGLQSPVAFVQDPTDRSVQLRCAASRTDTRGPRWGDRRERFFELDELSVVLRRAGTARARVRARLRVERPLLRELHEPRRQHGRRAVSAVRRSARRRSLVTVRFALERRRADSSHSRSRTTTADIWRSVRTAISTSASATAGRQRSRPSRAEPERAARQDAAHRRQRARRAIRSATAIPPDNPFARQAARRATEIWAFGLRNPWRYSFDDVARGGTGALVIGDVGQNRFEEIDYEPRGRGGRNYGWRNREGAHDNVTTPPPAFQPLTDPIFDYGRGDGSSITGGFVYRGTRARRGISRALLFRRLRRGRVWSLALDGRRRPARRTASDLLEHTAELGGARGARQHQLVRRRRRRRALSSSVIPEARIVRITAPLTVPAVPSGLKIVKP